MDIPPKAVRHQVRSLGGFPPSKEEPAGSAELTPLLAGSRSLPGERGHQGVASLPVLNAFQEFLDKERRRARRRLAALAFGLVALFLTLAAVGALVGLRVLGQLAERVSDTQSQVASLRAEASALRAGTKHEMDRLAGEADRLGNELSRRQAALAAAEFMPAQVAAFSNDLAELRVLLSGLTSTNASLREELNRVKGDLAARASGAGARPRTPARAAAPAHAAPEPSAPLPPPATAPLTLAITAPDQSEPVTWRLLIPE
jgi:hypothetical protein